MKHTTGNPQDTVGMDVMVVEDDAFVRRALCRLLAKSGYRVYSASNAIDAIDLAVKHEPELVISDWNLEGELSGVDLLRVLEQELPDSRLVMITGNSIDELKRASQGVRIAAILEKPFYARQILTLVESL